MDEDEMDQEILHFRDTCHETVSVLSVPRLEKTFLTKKLWEYVAYKKYLKKKIVVETPDPQASDDLDTDAAEAVVQNGHIKPNVDDEEQPIPEKPNIPNVDLKRKTLNTEIISRDTLSSYSSSAHHASVIVTETLDKGFESPQSLKGDELIPELLSPELLSPENIEGPRSTPESLSSDSQSQHPPTPVNPALIDTCESEELPYSHYVEKYGLMECWVRLEVLKAAFLKKAQKGQIHWSEYFRDPSLVAIRKRKFQELPSDPEYVESDVSDASSSHEDNHSDFEEDVILRNKKKGHKKNSGNSPAEPRVRRKRSSVVLHKCDRCTFSTNSKKDLQLHSAIHRNGSVTPIKCPECQSDHYRQEDLDIHRYEAHEGPKKLERKVIRTCKSCRLDFDDEQDFEFHVVNHVQPTENGLRYKCTLCTYSSEKYATVSLHMRNHVFFKCTFCDRTFNKLKQVEGHCKSSHKKFGQPFTCHMCDYKTAVFGLLLEHMEDSHAIQWEKNDMLKCKLCGDKNFLYTNRETFLNHLAIHVDIHLYKCVKCNFTAMDTSMFNDHVIEMHIELMVETTDYFEETNVDLIMKKISTLVKRKFGKSEFRNSRPKPTPQETQNAVAALLGNDDSQNEETSSNNTLSEALNSILYSDDNQSSDEDENHVQNDINHNEYAVNTQSTVETLHQKLPQDTPTAFKQLEQVSDQPMDTEVPVEMPSYYDPDSKILFFNGEPVMDSEGHPVAIEPENVEQVLHLLTSTLANTVTTAV